MRKKLTIHNPFPLEEGYSRNYRLFWDMLIDTLRKDYDVTEHRYYEDASKHQIEVKLAGGTVDGFFLYDTDMVIENEKNEFIIFTVTDIIHPNVIMEKNNPKLKKVFIAQHPPQYISANVRDDLVYNKKYFPWIYFPCTTTNLEPFYHWRKHNKNFIDKMVFRGGADHRKIVTYFSTDILTGTDFLGSEKEYYEDVIKHKVGLSVGGRGEVCYRDVEYMAMGVPFLRFKYQSKLLPDLIPNFHYISVDVPDDLPVDPHRNDMPDDSRGTERHAELLTKRFLEVKDDQEFLDFIARNAKIYYDTYLAPHKNVQYTIRLIQDFLQA